MYKNKGYRSSRQTTWRTSIKRKTKSSEPLSHSGASTHEPRARVPVRSMGNPGVYFNGSQRGPGQADTITPLAVILWPVPPSPLPSIHYDLPEPQRSKAHCSGRIGFEDETGASCALPCTVVSPISMAALIMSREIAKLTPPAPRGRSDCSWPYATQLLVSFLPF